MTQTESTPAAVVESPHHDEKPPLYGRAGQWELLGQIAEGRYTQTCLARPVDSPPGLAAAYVVKILLPEYQDDLQAMALLCREAAATHKVSHPNVVPILAASLRQTPRFLVTPHIEGETLRARLEAGQLDPAWAMDLPVALWIARQVAEALDAILAAGWTHGDVKPGNVLLSPENHVTLLDLGFARRIGEDLSLNDSCVAGTFRYMAPELTSQAARADARSDVYSLGVMLFEMLSGRLPFTGESPAALSAAHRSGRPPDLRRLVPQLPDGVVSLVRQLLAKEPLRRPQTPRELIQRLVALEIAAFSERAW